jgi:hypothetical protein
VAHVGDKMHTYLLLAWPRGTHAVTELRGYLSVWLIFVAKCYLYVSFSGHTDADN